MEIERRSNHGVSLQAVHAPLRDWYLGSPERALRFPASMAIEERGGKSKDQEFNGERREQYGDGKADYCLDRSRTHGFEEQVGQSFSQASYPLAGYGKTRCMRKNGQHAPSSAAA